MSATLAEKNGRVSFESGRPLNESNPYRRGTPLFDLFVKGWNAAASAHFDVIDAAKPFALGLPAETEEGR